MIDCGNSEDLRPRRHHFAHQLVAELDSGTHQVAIALFENAFFFAGLKQRLDVGRGLHLPATGFSASEATEKKKRMMAVMGVMSQSSRRMGHTSRAAQRPLRVCEEQRRQKLVAEDDHQHDHQHSLRDLRVGRPCDVRGAIKKHRANGQCEDAKRKLLQHGGAERGMFARKADQRLDLFFPLVEIVLHLARQDLAELGVDAADVGREGVDWRRNHQEYDGDQLIERGPFARVPECATHVRPLDQPMRQTEPCPQVLLAPRHLRLCQFRGRIRRDAASREASAP